MVERNRNRFTRFCRHRACVCRLFSILIKTNDREPAKSAKNKRNEGKKISLFHFASSFALFAISRFFYKPGMGVTPWGLLMGPAPLDFALDRALK
jgi:hypothetical protein